MSLIEQKMALWRSGGVVGRRFLPFLAPRTPVVRNLFFAKKGGRVETPFTPILLASQRKTGVDYTDNH